LKIMGIRTIVKIRRLEEVVEEPFFLVIPRSECDQESAVFRDFRDTADPSLRSI
jgi:hypothetical protein